MSRRRRARTQSTQYSTRKEGVCTSGTSAVCNEYIFTNGYAHACSIRVLVRGPTRKQDGEGDPRRQALRRSNVERRRGQYDTHSVLKGRCTTHSAPNSTPGQSSSHFFSALRTHVNDRKRSISRPLIVSIAAGNVGAPASIDPRYNADSQAYASLEEKGGGFSGDVGHMGMLDEEQY